MYTNIRKQSYKYVKIRHISHFFGLIDELFIMRKSDTNHFVQ